MSAPAFKPKERVRYNAFGRIGDSGTVIRSTPVRLKMGGVKARVRVRWDKTGNETLVDDRVLEALPKERT